MMMSREEKQKTLGRPEEATVLVSKYSTELERGPSYQFWTDPSTCPK